MGKLFEVTERGRDLMPPFSGFYRTGELLIEGSLHDCFIFAVEKWPNGGPRDANHEGRFIHRGPPDYKTVGFLKKEATDDRREG